MAEQAKTKPPAIDADDVPRLPPASGEGRSHVHPQSKTRPPKADAEAPNRAPEALTCVDGDSEVARTRSAEDVPASSSYCGGTQANIPPHLPAEA